MKKNNVVPNDYLSKGYKIVKIVPKNKKNRPIMVFIIFKN
jgi:hypothetical protein